MKNFLNLTNFFIVLFLIFSGCKVLKNGNSVPFIVEDAHYYSWFASGQESGTNIQIVLNDVSPGVKFDSLIFRNIRIPVYSTGVNGEIILNGTIPGGTSKLRIKTRRVEKSNRIIYHYNDRRCFYLLRKIRKEDIKYFM